VSDDGVTQGEVAGRSMGVGCKGVAMDSSK
jgi:hypothetical protein